MKLFIKSLFFVLVCLATTKVFAQTISVKNSNGVTIKYKFYNPNGGGLELAVANNSYSGIVIIPKTVIYNKRTWKVTSIGADAFYNCSGLTSVNIPSSVTSIGHYAFKGCSGLTSVNIPSSVTSIGCEAFRGCTGLTSVNIPSSVTSIGHGAFEDCSGLTSVTIPEGVTKTGIGIFNSCTSLMSVTIPEGSVVVTEENGWFDGCTALKSLTVRMKDGSTQTRPLPY